MWYSVFILYMRYLFDCIYILNVYLEYQRECTSTCRSEMGTPLFGQDHRCQPRRSKCHDSFQLMLYRSCQIMMFGWWYLDGCLMDVVCCLMDVWWIFGSLEVWSDETHKFHVFILKDPTLRRRSRGNRPMANAAWQLDSRQLRVPLSRGNRGTCLVLPFLNRQRSTVQATFVIFTNPINLINLILSTSLDKFHLWAKSTTPMTRGSRNRDDDNDDTMLFRFTRSRPGDQEKSTVFFQNPEKPGEIRKSPAVFQKKNLRSLKKQQKNMCKSQF